MRALVSSSTRRPRRSGSRLPRAAAAALAAPRSPASSSSSSGRGRCASTRPGHTTRGGRRQRRLKLRVLYGMSDRRLVAQARHSWGEAPGPFTSPAAKLGRKAARGAVRRISRVVSGPFCYASRGNARPRCQSGMQHVRCSKTPVPMEARLFRSYSGSMTSRASAAQ